MRIESLLPGRDKVGRSPVWSAASSYADVRSQPTLPRSLEQGFEAPDLGIVPYCLSCYHLPKEGEESLV
jgi:hypothetical protein